MKKSQVNWKKFDLSDKLIIRLGSLYLGEEEWRNVWASSGHEDPLLIAHFLYRANIISLEQYQIWTTKKEWIKER